ncbi:phosphopantetheine-binding protein [Streptomyces sp. NBRC 109706]|uniref:phosphopantetheine-binding protein n=1 Tax=Streptomyces sp. NBRC 109706 TaxID=1550035 RepID=UPI000781E615|nr:phosphopantetheine-binding protein [Streptomyces sp. NBRC 109706]
MSAEPPVLTPAQLRADVYELLGHEVPDEAHLFDEGLDSVRLMSLVERWRAQGGEAGFIDYLQEPTLAAWTALLADDR